MSKVRDLPEVTTLDDNDLLYTVDSSEGANGGRKITKENLKESIKPTDSETKTAYENNANTNAFTDAEKTKLAGIESGATADQDANEVPYDNNGSTLDAMNVEDAIDELDAEKENAFAKNSAFNKNFGSTAGTVVEGNDNRLSTTQKLTVKKNPGAGQFSSVKAAVDSISDASITKPYQINIGPGIYEEDTINVPSYVHLRGERGATIIKAADPTQDIFVINSNCSVAQLRVEGATGPNAAAFRRTAGVTESFINIVESGNNTKLVSIDSTSGSPTVIVNGGRIVTNAEFETAFEIFGTGNGSLVIETLTGLVSGTGVNPDVFLKGSGSTNTIVVLSSEIRVTNNASLEKIIECTDGVSLFLNSLVGVGANKGLSVPNTGAGPVLNISGLNLNNMITSSVEILNPNTSGFVSGAWDFEKSNIDQSVSENMNLFFTETEDSDIGIVAYGDIIQGTSSSDLLNISKLNREEATLGLVSGGSLTTDINPFQINIEAGNGFIKTSGDVSKEVSWEDTSITIPADSSRYVTVNDSGTVQLEVSLPVDLSERVVLGRIASGDNAIVRVEETAISLKHHGNQVERYLRNTFGAIFASGSLVVENGSSAGAFDITAGEYYYGTKRFAPSGGNEVSLTQLKKDGLGGFTVDQVNSQIEITKYDDGSGTLQDIPAGKFVKGVIVMGGEGAFESYTYVYGQDLFDNFNLAVAGNIPQLPNQILDAVTVIAAVITTEGASNITEILDIRPRPSFAASSAGGSASDHGSLTGLSDDDHPQYLPINGGRAMTGNLNMGTNNVINGGTYNGVDVESHASRHLPNGADPLNTSAPVTNLNGNTANSVGAANSLSRSDHTHAIDNASPSVAGLMSATDKTKLNGIESGATADQDANEVPYDNSGSTLSATDVDAGLDELDDRLVTNENATAAHVNGGPSKHDATEVDYERVDGSKIDIAAGSDNVETALTDLDDNKLSRTGSQAMTGNLDMGGNSITNVSQVDGVDVSNHASRHLPNGADALATAAASTLNGDTTNQVGSANSLARSDHSHNIETGSPSVNLSATTANAEGSAAELARADHSHAINTGAPSSALSANSSNAEGTSPNLARADHSHDLSTGVVSTQTPAQANAEGASANLARADHTHNMPVGTPSNVGAANSEGSASAFARQDHVHNVFPIFGRVYAENNAIGTTTSGAFQTALTANITVPAGGGVYEISWYYEWNFDSTGGDFVGRVQLDNSIDLMEHRAEPQDSAGGGFGGSDQSFPVQGFAQVNLTAGSHTVDIDIASGDGFNTAAIRRRRIKIVRVG